MRMQLWHPIFFRAQGPGVCQAPCAALILATCICALQSNYATQEVDPASISLEQLCALGDIHIVEMAPPEAQSCSIPIDGMRPVNTWRYRPLIQQ